jgi:hypothetical protein
MMEMAVPGFKLEFSERVFRNGGYQFATFGMIKIRAVKIRAAMPICDACHVLNLSPRNQSGRCLGRRPLDRMLLAYLQRAEEASPASLRLLSAMTLGRRR